MFRPLTAMSVLTIGCVAYCDQPPSHDGNAKSIAAATMDVLDLNGDDRVDPYEAAVAIERAARWNGTSNVVTRRLLTRYIRQSSAVVRDDANRLMQRHDFDRDNQLSTAELDVTDKECFVDADFNWDGRVSRRELTESLRFGNLVAASDHVWIADELDAWMEDDIDGNRMLSRNELTPDDWTEIEFADCNRDGNVDAKELEVDLRGHCCEAGFTIVRNVATMIGMIGPTTPARVMELIVEHPDVDTIVMRCVPGSIDEDANRIAAEMIHRHRFTAIVPEGGLIASGGTDFFLAATKRFAHPTSRTGVHAWADANGSATRDRDAKEHELYLEGYKEWGITTAFYWFSLEVAPANQMHWMTIDERTRFGMTNVPGRGGL